MPKALSAYEYIWYFGAISSVVRGRPKPAPTAVMIPATRPREPGEMAAVRGMPEASFFDTRNFATLLVTAPPGPATRIADPYLRRATPSSSHHRTRRG